MPARKSIQIITLGCSKNTVDTEHLLYYASQHLEVIGEMEGDVPWVDYLLLNTCAFIADAKEESVQAVLEASRRKSAGRVGKLMVFGCLSQRYAAELPDLIPEVDAWFGARDLSPVLEALDVSVPDEWSGRLRTGGGPGTAFLKISEGCDRHCSYCAIPSIRGAHRSVPMETLLREAQSLSAEGVHELIIIAQDTTYYGLDLYGRRTLGELLAKLSEIEGIEWLRIHYSYPSGFPDDVLEQMASNPKVLPYLDIPLQHISDGVLSKMRRGAGSAFTRALIARMRERVPGVVLRTTMIVGHPGEGEAEFRELMDFVREARFERLGAFAYSEEEGTYGASHFADAVPEAVKQERLSQLMELQQDISLAFNQSRIGTVERVLVDAWADGALVCRSRYESPDVDGEILVALPADRDPESLCGTFVDVIITGADAYDLTAQII